MSRLTKKYEDNYNLYIKLPTIKKQEFLNKLGKLEDLEEELGCPLDVIAKATTKGIYTSPANDWGNYSNLILVRVFWNGNFFFINQSMAKVYIKDYKKTWWLRKDKSE